MTKLFEAEDSVLIGTTGCDVWSVVHTVLEDGKEFAKVEREGIYVMIPTRHLRKAAPLENQKADLCGLRGDS